jgi:predicted transglutaminase-like cysteine proteinase
MRSLVRLASIFLIAIVCCRASPAAEYPGIPTHAIESRVTATLPNHAAETAPEGTRPQLARVETGDVQQRTIKLSKPPGLQATGDPAAEISAKWADLQSRIQSEEATLAACRAGSIDCPAAARRLLHIVELGRQRQGLARLGEINRAVNLSIRPVSDWVQYGVADFWAAPLDTLSSGAGDCKDYAIVKYVALREAGIAPDDLRIIKNAGKIMPCSVSISVSNGCRWII